MQTKKISLGQIPGRLSRMEMKLVNGGVQQYCDTYIYRGSDGSGSSMTCDYEVHDASGGVRPLCETACINGCNYSGCTTTVCWGAA